MDRKARIRQYKETPRTAGVFCVRNLLNGKSFVGSSVDLPAMLNRQRFQLESGAHPNQALQKDWNEVGPEVFEFEVLVTLDPPAEPAADVSDDLRTLEQMCLQSLRDEGVGLYNVERVTQGKGDPA